MPQYAKQGENLLYQKNSKNGLKSRKYSKYKELWNNDKNPIYLPRQNANPILQCLNNQGYKLIAQSFYHEFTTFH